MRTWIIASGYLISFAINPDLQITAPAHTFLFIITAVGIVLDAIDFLK